MKAHRLDNHYWYDKENDLVQCLVCSKWFQLIHPSHIKKHGFSTTSEYKQEFNILPGTPLKSKALLNVVSKLQKERIARGENKTFRPGHRAPKEQLEKSLKAAREARKLINFQGDEYLTLLHNSYPNKRFKPRPKKLKVWCLVVGCHWLAITEGYCKHHYDSIHSDTNKNRNNRVYKFNDKLYTLPELARTCNINVRALYGRLVINNWTVEEAVNNNDGRKRSGHRWNTK